MGRALVCAFVPTHALASWEGRALLLSRTAGGDRDVPLGFTFPGLPSSQSCLKLLRNRRGCGWWEREDGERNWNNVTLRLEVRGPRCLCVDSW